MIKVIASKLTIYSNDDLGKKVSKDIWNKVAEDFAKKVQEGVRDKKCKNHPQSDQTVIVHAIVDGIKIEKNFCCDEFRELIQINVKK